MKQRKFLAYILAGFASVAVIVGCSDKDEPPFDPAQNDPSYNDTIIYIDESSDEERAEWDGGLGLMEFTKESLDGYRVIVTRKLFGGSYQIYIPADGASLNLVQAHSQFWMEATDYTKIGEDKIYLDEKLLGRYPNDSERYYWSKSNRYITITHDTYGEIRFDIPENTSKEVRQIELLVTNGFVSGCGADMIFIQEGAK